MMTVTDKNWYRLVTVSIDWKCWAVISTDVAVAAINFVQTDVHMILLSVQ